MNWVASSGTCSTVDQSDSPYSQSNGVNGVWTDPSETVGLNKPFYFSSSFHFQYFVISKRKRKKNKQTNTIPLSISISLCKEPILSVIYENIASCKLSAHCSLRTGALALSIQLCPCWTQEQRYRNRGCDAGLHANTQGGSSLGACLFLKFSFANSQLWGRWFFFLCFHWQLPVLLAKKNW